MKVYAFDVDETLEISAGPVRFQSIIDLRNEGHVVGLCGNWALVTMNFPEWWHRLFAFIGPMLMTKSEFLAQVKQFVPADEHVMVGNDPRVFGQSGDAEAAQLSGWRFMREVEFAGGSR